MLFSELKKKEVINLKNCQKLGRVSDFEFDECTGQIFKLIIPGENKWCGLFGSDSNYVICYKDQADRTGYHYCGYMCVDICAAVSIK